MTGNFFISKFRNWTVGKTKIVENHEKPASQAHPSIDGKFLILVLFTSLHFNFSKNKQIVYEKKGAEGIAQHSCRHDASPLILSELYNISGCKIKQQKFNNKNSKITCRHFSLIKITQI